MSLEQVTWRALIFEVMEKNGETWDDVVSVAIPDGWLDRPFSDGYGSAEGHPFTLWTHRRVYFPTVYDGAEFVRSVPREPCNEMTRHVGGGAGYYVWDDDECDDDEPGEER